MHDESFRSLKDNNLPRLNIADQIARIIRARLA
jgi:hypothetical protein